ncbi:MAG: hypothetical protein ACERNK_14460, partial [Deltaproteobacteria bacterium]
VGLALALPFGALGGDVEISSEPQDERIYLVEVLKEDIRIVAALECEAGVQDEPSSFEAGTLPATTIDATALRATNCWRQRGAQDGQQSQSTL